MKECKYCNKKFTPNRSKQLFCNSKCTNKFHELKRVKVFNEVNCKKCNLLFTPRAYNNCYCSKECKETRNAKAAKVKKCKICSIEFKTSHFKKEYCSYNCRENNIDKRISRNIRNRVWYAINKYRPGSAIKDLGCTVVELKRYLESQFQDGMSWENYGEWHIDHIEPLANFDLTDREQFKKAVHYTNLQPLWAIDNLIKGAKNA